MNGILIIGLCGKGRSGKDTVAKHLVSEHGFFRAGSGDGVRGTFTDMDGPTWELRKELEEAGLTQRWATQVIGDECREDIGERCHWVNQVVIKLRYLTKYHPVKRELFVVPDIRYKHEGAKLTEWASCWGGSFVCWKLDRPGFGLTGDAAKHVSETMLESIRPDLIIGNTSSLGDLRSIACYHAIELLNARKAADQQ